MKSEDLKLVIKVTAKDIAIGAPKCAYDCPVAIAITRAAQRIPTRTKIVSTHVSVRHAHFDIGEDRWEYHLPEYVSTKIRAFDRGTRIKPFRFTGEFKKCASAETES